MNIIFSEYNFRDIKLGTIENAGFKTLKGRFMLEFRIEM